MIAMSDQYEIPRPSADSSPHTEQCGPSAQPRPPTKDGLGIDRSDLVHTVKTAHHGREGTVGHPRDPRGGPSLPNRPDHRRSHHDVTKGGDLYDKDSHPNNI